MKIFVSSKVKSCIANLEKTDKAGMTLAQKANNIIDSLTSGNAWNHKSTKESYTKYGEKRIKHCRKYDLGCGYRLITLQRGETVFIPFFGSHDECQRWLENNSRLKSFHAGKGSTIQIKDGPLSQENPNAVEDMDKDEHVDSFLHNLTDKELRTVFAGLVEAANKKAR